MKLAPRKTGWIGVDLGTSTVKIAQVVRSPRGLRLAAAAVVPRPTGWSADLSSSSSVLSSINEISAACSIEDGYRGRRVAGMLSMSLCDMHLLDRPLTQEIKTQQIIRQAIETATQQSAEKVQFDYWSAPAREGKPGWTQALAVGKNWTEQLVEDVAHVGWSCEAIDGLPLAITRAVGLVDSDDSQAPLAALDLGHSRATLCLIENGQPTYVRCLKGCGLRSLLDALTNNLQVSEVEAQQLLEEYGLATPTNGEQSEIASLVQEIIAAPMGQLVEEIQRSLSHYQYLRRAKAPQRLYLFGGGATINHVDNWLSDRLELATQVWQLPGQEPRGQNSHAHADCIFASAIALSALAWEKS